MAYVFYLYVSIAFVCASASAQTSAQAAEKTRENRAFRQALVFAAKKDFQRSLGVLRKLVSEYPDRSLYWFNLGNVYYQLAQYEYAIQCYQVVAGNTRSGLAVPATLYMAKSYRRLKNWERSQQLLDSKNAATLPPHLAAEWNEERDSIHEEVLKQGVVAYQEGKYEKAHESIDRAVSIRPTSQDYLLKALTLYRQAEFDAARVALQEARQLSGDEIEKKDVQELLNSTREDKRNWRPVGSVGFSLGVDSNYFADGESDPQKGIIFANFSGFYGGNFSRTKDVSLGAVLFLGENEPIGMPDERMFQGVIEGVATGTVSGWTLVGKPALHYNFKGSSSFLVRYGAAVSMERAWDRHVVGFSVQHLLNDPISFEAFYLTGYSQIRKLFWNYRASGWTTKAALVHQVDATSDLVWDGGRLPLAGETIGPWFSVFFRLPEMWEGEVVSSVLFRSFEHLAEPGDERRSDRQLNVSFRAAHGVGRDAKVYGLIDFKLNRSTLGDNSVENKNYTEWVAQGGMVWELPQ